MLRKGPRLRLSLLMRPKKRSRLIRRLLHQLLPRKLRPLPRLKRPRKRLRSEPERKLRKLSPPRRRKPRLQRLKKKESHQNNKKFWTKLRKPKPNKMLRSPLLKVLIKQLPLKLMPKKRRRKLRQPLMPLKNQLLKKRKQPKLKRMRKLKQQLNCNKNLCLFIQDSRKMNTGL